MQNVPFFHRHIGRHIPRQIHIRHIPSAFARAGFCRQHPGLIRNRALSVPGLPFRFFMGMPQVSAANAVVGMFCHRHAQRQRRRGRVVVRFRGIGVNFMFARRCKDKCLVYHNVRFRIGRLAQHLIICHRRIFHDPFASQQRQHLFPNAHRLFDQLHRRILAVFVSVYRQNQALAYVVSVRRRLAEDGSLPGLCRVRRQGFVVGKQRLAVGFVIPAIRCLFLLVAVHVLCRSRQQYALALRHAQRIASVIINNALARNRNRCQRRIRHRHILQFALFCFVRVKPAAVRRFIAAEFFFAVLVQKAARRAVLALVFNAFIQSRAVFKRRFAGIPRQGAHLAVVDARYNKRLRVFRIKGLVGVARFRYLNALYGHVFFHHHGAGFVERDAVVIVRVHRQNPARRQRGQRLFHRVIPYRRCLLVFLHARGRFSAANRAAAVFVIGMGF